MKQDIFDKNGGKVGEAVLEPKIFGVSPNFDLMHQVLMAQEANARQNIAHVKDRGEVRGGGRKPWRQKGTGRSRHSSIRSPIWRKGGVTFGPRNEKNFSKELPEKMRKKALLMALSDKASQNRILVLEKIELEKQKTAEMAKILAKFSKAKSGLLILSASDKNIAKAAKNIKKINVIEARNVNLRDVLMSKNLIFLGSALDELKKTLFK